MKREEYLELGIRIVPNSYFDYRLIEPYFNHLFCDDYGVIASLPTVQPHKFQPKSMCEIFAYPARYWGVPLGNRFVLLYVKQVSNVNGDFSGTKIPHKYTGLIGYIVPRNQVTQIFDTKG